MERERERARDAPLAHGRRWRPHLHNRRRHTHVLALALSLEWMDVFNLGAAFEKTAAATTGADSDNPQENFTFESKANENFPLSKRTHTMPFSPLYKPPTRNACSAGERLLLLLSCLVLPSPFP